MKTAPVNIQAYKRVPFDDTLPFLGVDYSAAVYAMEIRNDPGDQGAPLVTLGASEAGGQGLSATLDPAYPHPATGVEYPATVLRIRINETTLEALPYGNDPDAPVKLAYDIHCTPSGGKKFVLAAGAFIVNPGVTL